MILPISADGSFDVRAARAYPSESQVGVPFPVPPCLVLPDKLDGKRRIVIVGRDTMHFASEVPVDVIHYYPGAGIAAISSGWSRRTEVFVFADGETKAFPGLCPLSAFNRESKAIALTLLDPDRKDSGRLVVFDRQGSVLVDLAEPFGELALQKDWVIVGGLQNQPRTTAVNIPKASRHEMPLLPRGLRSFSADGTHLLIEHAPPGPPSVSFHDLTNPLTPVLLWSRDLPDSVRLAEWVVSYSGKAIAWHLQADKHGFVDLVLLDRTGQEVGRARHNETYIVDGLHFLDDRYLLEGVYRERGFNGTTRTARLYDLKNLDGPGR